MTPNAGKLYVALIVSVLLSCVAAWLIARLYRRRMQQLMRAPHAGESAAPGAETAPDVPLPLPVSLADNHHAGIRLILLLIALSCLMALTSASIWYALRFPGEPLLLLTPFSSLAVICARSRQIFPQKIPLVISRHLVQFTEYPIAVLLIKTERLEAKSFQVWLSTPSLYSFSFCCLQKAAAPSFVTLIFSEPEDTNVQPTVSCPAVCTSNYLALFVSEKD